MIHFGSNANETQPTSFYGIWFFCKINYVAKSDVSSAAAVTQLNAF